MPRKSQLERDAEAVAEIEAKIAEEIKAQEEPKSDEVKEEPKEEPKAKPEEQTDDAKVTAPAADATPKTPDPLPEINVWEQRYKSLDGKYRAEVPRLHAEVKELKAKLESVEKAKPEHVVTPETSVISAEDIENYGEDLINLIKRQAEAVANSTSSNLQTKLEKLAQENAQLKQQLSGVSESVANTTQQTVLTQLAKYVPNWEQVNVDPEFIKWLSDFDQMSGTTRQELLNTAFEAGDAQRLGVIFQTYLKTKPSAVTEPTPKQNPVEQQVAPGNSRRGNNYPQDNPNEKVWSAEEIAAFYDEARAGKAYSPDEIKKIENQIDLAVAAGRVKM